MSRRNGSFVGSPAVKIPRWKPSKRLLVVAPSSWNVSDLCDLKELLAERYRLVVTLRDSGELVLTDVIDALSEKTDFILVLGENEQSWGNRNRRDIETAATGRGIKVDVLPTMPVESVIALYA